jgi:molybdopterin converting factor small subunit
MEVVINLFGYFKEFCQEAICLRFNSAPTVERLVNCLVSKLGQSFQDAFIDPVLHNPSSRALILIDGTEIGVLQGLNTQISNGDEIVILPVSHGG